MFLKLSCALIVFSSTFAFAAPACGLKGSINKRLAACEKAFRKNELIVKRVSLEQIWIPEELKHDPLGGIDESQTRVLWKLVSIDALGNELWADTKAKKLWMRLTQEAVDADSVENPTFDVACAKFAREIFALKKPSFKPVFAQATQDEIAFSVERGMANVSEAFYFARHPSSPDIFCVIGY